MRASRANQICVQSFRKSSQNLKTRNTKFDISTACYTQSLKTRSRITCFADAFRVCVRVFLWHVIKLQTIACCLRIRAFICFVRLNCAIAMQTLRQTSTRNACEMSMLPISEQTKQILRVSDLQNSCESLFKQSQLLSDFDCFESDFLLCV
jgi:hypothetical protein